MCPSCYLVASVITGGAVAVTVTVTINGLVKLSAFNAHICPFKYLASF